jgi:hypothetical protein
MSIHRKISTGMGAAALMLSLSAGFAPAQAAPPEPTPTPTPTVTKAPCTIASKLILLGHDRWMLKARLFRDGKRYPRHALSLVRISADGTTETIVSTKFGKKNGKWNWRMTGLKATGETVQAVYAGDDTTEACEGAVFSPATAVRPTD